MKLPIALITGAARRIGAEIAKHLHRNGYQVIIHCHHSQAEAESLAATLNTIRPNSAYVAVADLGSREGCEELIDKALSFEGRLDALINNASAFFPTPIEDVNEQQWQQLFNTNLKAPFILSQRASAALKLQSGSIINITDIHANKPLSGYSVYSMSKAGLISMTQSLAKELAPKIRVNAVSPGAILWPEHELENSEKQQNVIARIPLKRMGAAKDIAQTVLFLLQSEYITGQIINVDGGRTLAQ